MKEYTLKIGNDFLLGVNENDNDTVLIFGKSNGAHVCVHTNYEIVLKAHEQMCCSEILEREVGTENWTIVKHNKHYHPN